MLTGGGVFVFFGWTAVSLGNKGLGSAMPWRSASDDADGTFPTFKYRFRSTDAVRLIVLPAMAGGERCPLLFSSIAINAAS
jgi:hypothetical protein